MEDLHLLCSVYVEGWEKSLDILILVTCICLVSIVSRRLRCIFKIPEPVVILHLPSQTETESFDLIKFKV